MFDDCIEQRFSALVKYDLETRKSARHNFPEGVYGSEPAFAPCANSSSEDDGFLITFTADMSGNSEAHIIDAQNFAAPPVARVNLPQRVPAGFHGTWAAGV